MPGLAGATGDAASHPSPSPPRSGYLEAVGANEPLKE